MVGIGRSAELHTSILVIGVIHREIELKRHCDPITATVLEARQRACRSRTAHHSKVAGAADPRYM
jgi:hypothetical protein